MKTIEWVLAPLSAIAAGAFLFSANLHTDDTGIVAGLIFIFSAIVAFLFRRTGVLFGSAIGLSIIASELWNLHYGIPRSGMSTAQSSIMLSVVVSVISVLGSLAGFGLRRLVTQHGRAATK